MAKTSVYLNKRREAAVAGRPLLPIIDAGVAALGGTAPVPVPVPVAEPSAEPRNRAPADTAPEASTCKHRHVIKGWCRECRTGGH
jgi:hypothetical protein